MGERESRLPYLILEKFALGEMNDSEKTRALERLKREKEGEERLNSLKKSDAEFFERYPAERIVPLIKARANAENSRTETREPFWKKWGLAYAAPAMIAAVLLIVLLPSVWPEKVQNPVPDETIYLKGNRPHLILYRQSATPEETPEKLEKGATASAGDVLQIGYVAAGRAYGFVFSIDGKGTVTLHAPESADSGSPALSNEENIVTLSHSYELDDAPDFERFFFLTSDRPFQIKPILDSVQKIAAIPETARNVKLTLPKGIEQFSFLIRKVKTR